ncbi:hypothetical protein ACTD5D_41140 [Nocardia takedensis]|uniref:hypothetical protein n=1 Tax=Nocardia takedensis TaxID=259390 RepID=UPI003F76D9E3
MQPTPREAAPWTTLVRYHAPDSAPWDPLSMLKQGHNDRAAAAAWTQRTVDELVIEPGTTVSASLWRREEIEPDFIARGVPSEVVQEIGRRWIASPRETPTLRPVTVERAATNGHAVHEAVPSSSAQGDSRTEAVQEFDALVARNMAEAMPADAPEHAWSRLTDVHWHTITHGDDNVDEMARWWASEGAQAYWADKNPEAAGNGQRPSTESHEVRRLRAEIDRIKGQRDAAVQKLAAATPPEQRYGSPERQAEAAKQAAREQSAASVPQPEPAKPSPASTGRQVQVEEDYHQAVMSNPPEPEEEPVFELVED